MGEFRKAIVSGIVSGIGAFGTGLIAATSQDGIATNEWWAILGGTLVSASGAFGLVWRVPNDPAT